MFSAVIGQTDGTVQYFAGPREIVQIDLIPVFQTVILHPRCEEFTDLHDLES